MKATANERKKWSAENRGMGLEYRKCGYRHFSLDNTRGAGTMIIRYRRCRNCGQRMTTCERALGQT